MGSVVPLSRLATRARIRRDARRELVCDVHGSSNCRICQNVTRAWADTPDERARRAEGYISEGYATDAWRDPMMPRKALHALLVLIIAAVGLPIGVALGKAIVSAIWG